MESSNVFYTSCGRARFTVLTPALIRLEWSQIGAFEDRPSIHFTQRSAGKPGTVILIENNGAIELETTSLTLRWTPLAGDAVSWDSNLTITVNAVGTSGPVVWVPGMPDTQNLGGTVRTLDGVSGATTLSPGLVSRAGWVVYDDSESPVLDTVGSTGIVDNVLESELWPVSRAGCGAKDWYFFGHGHDYPSALRDYTTVAGKIPLPPKHCFGVWWSRYWPYTEDEFKALVQEFKSHDVPLDVLVIDMDWHKDGWTGYSWNPDCFKDPKGFLAWCKQQGLAVTLNLHPADGVGPHEDAYAEVCSSVGVPPDGRTVPFDVTSKQYRKR